MSAGRASGRDHNPHGFTMLAGRRRRQGRPGHRRHRRDRLRAVEDKVHVHDLHATILHLLGFNHRRLTYRHNGRDERLTDNAGEVIDKVLA